ncbi:RloB family protein [Streptosporangium subroseum]|uniref:RloB family protein n=1 Tax=Streptosporangium subroseum TaxID=106412 RepID=UPI0030935453|nr:RloB family protein [Streptosporangium subroseum]
MSRRSAIPRGDTRPGRTLGVNRAQRTLHVVCEGETEGDYLNLLEAYFGKEMRFHVNPYTRPEGFKPTGAVERAIEVRKSLYRDDRENVWVMFDRDEHFDVEKAVVLARKNKIKVAFSHPSFDLWLWVHFAPGRPTGQGGSSAFLVSKLQGVAGFESYAPKGDKRLLSLVRQGALSANLSQAIKLARRLDAGCESGLCDPDRRAADGGREPHDDRCAILKRDPSTGVYVLLESLGFTTA